ncbi:MAG: hypothetical protein AAB386_01905 [Patescibacteria group bacterium]
MEMKCSSCDAMMKEGETHCDKCKVTMTCSGEVCDCKCGNSVGATEIKCDGCLGGATE